MRSLFPAAPPAGSPLPDAPTSDCGRFRVLVLVALLSLTLSSFGQDSASSSAGEATAARVTAILKQVDERQGADYWATVGKLTALGGEVLPTVRQQIGQVGAGALGDRGRLACAAILLQAGELEDGDRAILVLERLLDQSSDKWVKVAAIRLLGLHASPDEIQPQLEERLKTTRDPEILIPLAEVLWEMDHVAEARDVLVGLLAARDLSVKREAALALAEMGYFEGQVRDVLRELKDEPSEQGRRAASLDRVMQLSRQLDRRLDDGEVLIDGVDPSKLLKIKDERIRKLEEELELLRGGLDSPGPDGAPAGDRFTQLLEEVVEKTQKFYVDAEKTDRKQLYLAAIEGMVSDLDRFSSFMGVSETQLFNESMSGEYFGIGAHVSKAGGSSPLEIRKILYGGPAHKAGVRSNDRVVAIDGKSILDLSLEAVIDQLKGPANTKITLTVRRPGGEGDQELVVLRGRVEVPSVHSDLLPGKIGYIRLSKFGDRSAEDFIAAVDALQERGLEGLIIDLRDNPGGRRDAAVHIVDQFVDGELPILTQKGRTGDEISTPPDPFRRPNYPMVILVSGSSASASEIVAGALQDYRRATVVGERTFGKGSVQRVIQMSPQAASTLGGDARLRLTVQYYYLPSGRCIHTIRDKDGRIIERGGIDPDIEEMAERIHEWEFLARERIHRDDEILKYANEHFEELKRLHDDADGKDPSRYPGFEDLYEKWKTTASKNDLRSVLRLVTRRRLEDERGSDFACDYLEDRQLQRGIVKLLDDLGKDPSSYAPYRRFREWLAVKPEERHATSAPASDTPELPSETETDTEPERQPEREPDPDSESDSGSESDSD